MVGRRKSNGGSVVSRSGRGNARERRPKEVQKSFNASPNRSSTDEVEVYQARKEYKKPRNKPNAENSPARSRNRQRSNNQRPPQRLKSTVQQDYDTPEYYNQGQTTAKKRMNDPFADDDHMKISSIKKERSKVFQEIKRRNYRRSTPERSGLYKSQFQNEGPSRRDEERRSPRRKSPSDNRWMKNYGRNSSRSPPQNSFYTANQNNRRKSVLDKFKNRGFKTQNDSRPRVNVEYDSEVPRQDDVNGFDPYM